MIVHQEYLRERADITGSTWRSERQQRPKCQYRPNRQSSTMSSRLLSSFFDDFLTSQSQKTMPECYYWPHHSIIFTIVSLKSVYFLSELNQRLVPMEKWRLTHHRMISYSHKYPSSEKRFLSVLERSNLLVCRESDICHCSFIETNWPICSFPPTLHLWCPNEYFTEISIFRLCSFEYRQTEIICLS